MTRESRQWSGNRWSHGLGEGDLAFAAEDVLEELPGSVSRELVLGQLDVGGDLEVRQGLSGPGLHLVFGDGLPWLDADDGFDLFAQGRVGHADAGGFGAGGVLDQAA